VASDSQNVALSWPMALKTPMPVRTARRDVPAMMNHPRKGKRQKEKGTKSKGHGLASCLLSFYLLRCLFAPRGLESASVPSLGSTPLLLLACYRQPEQMLQLAAEDEVMLAEDLSRAGLIQMGKENFCFGDHCAVVRQQGFALP